MGTATIIFVIFFVFIIIILLVIFVIFATTNPPNPPPPPPSTSNITGTFSINNTKIYELQNVKNLKITNNTYVKITNQAFNFLIPGNYFIQIYFNIKKQNTKGQDFRCYLFFQTISNKSEQLTVQNVNGLTKGPIFSKINQIGYSSSNAGENRPYIQQNQSADDTNGTCPLIFFVWKMKTDNDGIVYPNYSSLSFTINITSPIIYYLQSAFDPQDNSNKFPGNTMSGSANFYLDYVGPVNTPNPPVPPEPPNPPEPVITYSQINNTEEKILSDVLNLRINDNVYVNVTNNGLNFLTSGTYVIKMYFNILQQTIISNVFNVYIFFQTQSSVNNSFNIDNLSFVTNGPNYKKYNQLSYCFSTSNQTNIKSYPELGQPTNIVGGTLCPLILFSFPCANNTVKEVYSNYYVFSTTIFIENPIIYYVQTAFDFPPSPNNFPVEGAMTGNCNFFLDYLG